MKQAQTTIMHEFDDDSTREYDLALFKKLGLKPFKDIPLHKKHYVGKVKLADRSTIKISVTPCPAEFWHFEIYCAENKKTYQVDTGSGNLTHFWQAVEMIAENMLVVKEAQK